MRRVVLAHETDFEGFRAAARALVASGVAPGAVTFAVARAGETDDLFGAAEPAAAVPATVVAATAGETGGRDGTGAPRLVVSRRFLDMAETLACHSDADRFDLVYRLLWRLQREPRLLDVAADADVHRAGRLVKSVARDMHKMKAFVRFREIAGGDGTRYAAWFEPDHFVEERVAPFFVRRFAPMRFAIVTPRRSILWDTEDLAFGPGGRKTDVPAEDATEDLWLTYFAHIFNPARLKVKAMTAEMPKKYWKNLPEAALIPELVAGAQARMAGMVTAEPTPAPARHLRLVARHGETVADPPADADTLAALRREAEGCRLCGLWRDATQVVFGEGPPDAEIVVVGEQPGDREDLSGRPFVGPAGAEFDAALAAAGLLRERLYVTNAVKHFKFEPRGRRRLHKSPDAGEVQACRWWLERELRALSPRLVVGMGGSALRALLGRPVRITELRGRVIETPEGLPLFATVHPSYILRIPDPADQERERRRFAADMRQVADIAARLSVRTGLA